MFELVNKLSGTFTREDEEGLTELAAHASVALENIQDRQRLLAANRQLADQAAEGVRLIGNCPAMESLRSIVRRVAETDLAVLVGGENGTGKEVVAQIHSLPESPPRPALHRLELRARFPKRWRKANFSGTRKAPSPMPARPVPASSNWPRAAHFFSTRSAT